MDKELVVKMIKEDYEIKEDDNLIKLKKLNRKAKMPSTIFAYTFGLISALILGFGMSIALGAILKDLMVFGYIMGVIGLILVSINYPIYKKILNHGKNKYKDEIIELSNLILES